MSIKILSLNVGLPREVSWQGRIVTTGIFKEPVSSRLMLRALNLAGDKQADLTVHGGREKAAYAYPSEHYEYWRKELPGKELPFGMFGENFTIEGLLEDDVFIGDRFRIGEAELVVTQPRLPCYKLGVKFGRAEMVRDFLQSRRTGFYFAVLREGEVGAGDPQELIARDQTGVSVADITRIYAFEKNDSATLQRAMKVEALPEGWKEHFRRQLSKGKGQE